MAVACLAGLLVGQPASAAPPNLQPAGEAELPDSSRVSPQREAPAPGLAASGEAGGATVQVSPSGSPTYEYTDVGTNHFAALDIAALAADGVLAGTDCGAARFCPDTAIPRWQIAVWLVRVLDGGEPAPRASRFADVEGRPWWESHVERLAELGITKGCEVEPARFCPTDTVDRAQMAAFLDRAFNLPGAPQPAGFTDTEGVFSKDSIDSLFHSGITYGCSDVPLQFCPNRDVSRAQMAAFLQRGRPAPDDILSIGHDVRPDVAYYLSPLAGISNVEVSVHYCGPPDAFTEEMLVAETQKLNQVATFFERESGGESTLTLNVGDLHSPALASWPTTWAEESLTKWFESARSRNPCYQAVLGGSRSSSTTDRRDVALILADVDAGSGVAGFASAGGSLPYIFVQPSTRWDSSFRYTLVAHEIGHAAYALCHTFDGSKRECATQGADDDVKTGCRPLAFTGGPNCGGDERLIELAGSVMSYGQYGSYWKLSDSYVACEQKNWLGWHDKECGTPSAPRVQSVEPGDRQFSVSWTPPRDGGWSSITGYELAYRPRAGGDWRSLSRAASVTAAGFFNLRNGEEYEFRVRARNSEGAGDWSPIGTVTPTLLRPDAPARPRLTPGDEQVTVEWDAPDDNGERIIGYIVAHRRIGGGDWKSQTFTRSPTQRTITGLENDTQYQFRVRAINGLGPQAAGDWSPIATATPTADAQPPDAPARPRLTPGNEQITVEWDAPDDNGTPITGYIVEYREGGFILAFVDTSWKSRTFTQSPTQRTITGLENDTQYQFRVRARNSAGSEGLSDWSPTATATPTAEAQPPDAPDIWTSLGDGTITVDWTAPDDNGSPISGYTVYWREVESTSRASHSLGATARSWTIHNLTNGVAYEVAFTATNAVGESAEISDVLTPGLVPSAPSRVRLTPGDGRITVEWDAPDENAAAVAGYGVWWTTDVGVPPTEASWDGHDLSSTERSWTIPNLTNGVEYQVDVHAWNAAGYGNVSPSATATPTAAAQAPDAPGNLELTPGDGEILVEWDAPYDNGSPITAYTVYWTDDAWESEDSAVLTSTARSLLISGLVNGVKYEVDVSASNDVGEGTWSRATATPAAPVPGPPGNLRLTPGDGQILVEWAAPDVNAAAVAGYGVWWTGDGGESWDADNSLSSTARSWTVTGLENGVEYEVDVYAWNAASYGNKSSATATPVAPPDAPGNLRLTPGDGEILVEWDEPDDNGSPIWRYRVLFDHGGWSRLEVVRSTDRSYSISGLDNGVEYEVEVEAVNAVGRGDASSDTATPGVPDAPGTPRLTPGDAEIAVAWNTPDDNGAPITGYTLAWRSEGGDWKTASLPDGEATSATIKGLVNGVEYEVTIQAHNSRGPSKWWSPFATATPSQP